jgi:hypothetical protein
MLREDVLIEEEAWKEQAMCTTVAQRDPYMAGAWINEEDPQQDAARRICAACPVRQECALAVFAEREMTYGLRAGYFFRGKTLMTPEAREFFREFEVRVQPTTTAMKRIYRTEQ